jgi:hypothetical protein
MQPDLHASLVASVCLTSPPHDALSVLRAHIRAYDAGLANLARRKPYDVPTAARLVERRRKCETAIVDLLSGVG